MRLTEYLELPGIDRQGFAEKLGVHPDTLYKWERGDRRPRKEFMALISEATEGAVSPNDFFDLPPDELEAS